MYDLLLATSTKGDALLSNDICKGDTVRITLDGTVKYVNGGSTVDVDFEFDGKGDIREIEYVPKSMLTVTAPVAPAEPAMGTLITHYNSKYFRTSKGWQHLDGYDSTLGNPVKWTDFQFSAVRVMAPGDLIKTARA